MMENQKGRKLMFLNSDNRGEYTTAEFKDYLAGEGIEYQLSISGRLGHNGEAERMNQILTECNRSMRLHADIQKDFG